MTREGLSGQPFDPWPIWPFSVGSRLGKYISSKKRFRGPHSHSPRPYKAKIDKSFILLPLFLAECRPFRFVLMSFWPTIAFLPTKLNSVSSKFPALIVVIKFCLCFGGNFEKAGLLAVLCRGRKLAWGEISTIHDSRVVVRSPLLVHR